MPQFTLRWANRGTSDQDWNIQNLDSFTLQPDYTRRGQITLNANRTFNIAVNTDNRFAAAALTYTAGTNTWALNSLTPNEWQLAVGGGIVTVRCFLSNANEVEGEDLRYEPQEAERDAA